MEKFESKQFNQEVFESELETLMSTYQKDCWEFTTIARSNKKNDGIMDSLQNKKDRSMEKMVIFTVQALKISKDKKGVLEGVRKIFFSTATGNSFTPGDMSGPKVMERFFEDIILQLA